MTTDQPRIEWVATDPHTGYLPGMSRVSSAEDCLRELSWMLDHGGYAELTLENRPYPMMMLSFRGGRGIVQRLLDRSTHHLLAGDGSVAEDDVVLLPDIIDAEHYPGKYVLSAANAKLVVRGFVHTGAFDHAGPWLSPPDPLGLDG